MKMRQTEMLNKLRKEQGICATMRGRPGAILRTGPSGFPIPGSVSLNH
jgi:hypothetical protein